MQIYGPSHVHGAQSIHGPHSARSIESAPASDTLAASDRLDISEAGRIAGQLAEIPEIRADRVADIRAALANGTYETFDKLDVAMERLLDEIA